MYNHNSHSSISETPKEVLDQEPPDGSEIVSPPNPSAEASLAQTALSEVEAEKKPDQVKVTIDGQEITGDSYDEILYRLFIEGDSDRIRQGLDRVAEIDPSITQMLSRKLIDAGQAYSVAQNLSKFTGLDHNEINEIANKLIDADHGDVVD